MPNYLRFSYWFTIRQESFQPIMTKIVIGVFVMCFILGIIDRIFIARERDRFRKKLFRQISRVLFLNAFLGFVLVFFTIEEIPFLGMRLWFLILFIVDIAWVLLIFRNYIKDAPVERQKQQKRQEFEKYLPKKRRN